MGLIKTLDSARDADAFMKLFASSIKPSAMVNYRMFIVNDDVDKDNVDHFVVMDEGLLVGIDPMKGFREVAIPELMMEVNSVYAAKIGNRDMWRSRGKLL